MALLAASAVLLYANRHNWFYHDEWDFLAHREAGNLEDLLSPHNEHWSTVPILIYRALYGIFGITTYWPYLGVLVVVHAVAAILVYTLLRRAGLPFVIRVPAALILVLFGAGHENMMCAFQFAFFGPVVILLGCLVLLGGAGSPRRDLWAALLLVVGVMTGGLGVAAAVGAAAALAITRQWRRAALVAGPALALYALWFAAFHDRVLGHGTTSTRDAVLGLPSLAFDTVAVGLAGIFGLPEAAKWSVLVAVAVAILVAASSRVGLGMVTVALLVSLGVFLVLIGLGRAAPPAVASRYRHLAALHLVPALGWLWTTVPIARRKRAVTIGLAALLGASVLTNVAMLRDAASHWRPIRELQRLELTASLAIIASGAEVSPLARPLTIGFHPDTAGLQRLVDSGRLALPAIDQLPQGLVLTQTTRLQNTFSFGPTGFPGAQLLMTSTNSMEYSGGDGVCASWVATGGDPFVVGVLVENGEVEIEVSQSGNTQVHRTDGLPFVGEGSVTVAMAAGATRRMHAVGAAESPLIRFDVAEGSDLRLCAAAVAWSPER